MPLSSAFDSELFRWQQCCKSINISSASMSKTTLLTSYGDNKFFPNVRELLKILAVLPVGSTEAERSCILLLKAPAHMAEKYDENRPTLRLGSYCDAWIYYTITCEQICKRFIAVHPRRMQRSSLFHNDN